MNRTKAILRSRRNSGKITQERYESACKEKLYLDYKRTLAAYEAEYRYYSEDDPSQLLISRHIHKQGRRKPRPVIMTPPVARDDLYDRLKKADFGTITTGGMSGRFKPKFVCIDDVSP